MRRQPGHAGPTLSTSPCDAGGDNTEMPFPASDQLQGRVRTAGGRWKGVNGTRAAIPALGFHRPPNPLIPRGWLSILTWSYRTHSGRRCLSRRLENRLPEVTSNLNHSVEARQENPPWISGSCAGSGAGGEGSELGVELLQLSRETGQGRGDRS